MTLTCRAHTTFFVDRSLRQVSFFSETMEVRLSSLMRMKHCRLNLLFSLFLLASCANAQLSITEEELTRIIGRSETVKTVTPLSLAANFERMHVRWILIARDIVLIEANSRPSVAVHSLFFHDISHPISFLNAFQRARGVSREPAPASSH